MVLAEWYRINIVSSIDRVHLRLVLIERFPLVWILLDTNTSAVHSCIAHSPLLPFTFSHLGVKSGSDVSLIRCLVYCCRVPPLGWGCQVRARGVVLKTQNRMRSRSLIVTLCRWKDRARARARRRKRSRLDDKRPLMQAATWASVSGIISLEFMHVHRARSSSLQAVNYVCTCQCTSFYNVVEFQFIYNSFLHSLQRKLTVYKLYTLVNELFWPCGSLG